MSLAELASGVDGIVTGETARQAWPVDAAEPSRPIGGGSVRFEALKKSYTTGKTAVRALRGIDLAVEPGRIFGIIGRSGAGKSSLIRTVNRLETPTAGRVLVDGEDIGLLDGEGLLALRRRIGMIFQHFNLLSAKTVRANVALPLKVAGVGKQEIARRVEEVLALVGLSDKRDVYPSQLSGGQKQRVGIARALVHSPEILLCDEATSALDPETTQSILRLLKALNQQLGLTIILITHEMSVIREICDEVVVLESGVVVEAGPVWQVFSDPQHDATQALLKPLDRALPEDIAASLSATRRSGDQVLVEIRLKGAQVPDLGRFSAALGASARLLDASLDRLQGHSQGRLLFASPQPPDVSAFPSELGSIKVLGHVPGND